MCYNPSTMTTTKLNRFISVGQAAKRLGMNYKKICRWADSGRIPCIRTAGGHRRVNISFLIADRADGESVALGRMLRQFRKERGLTLMKMAADIGVSTTFISAVETGKKRASGNFITRVQQAYHPKEKEFPKLEAKIEPIEPIEPEVVSIDLTGTSVLARKMIFTLVKRLPLLAEVKIKDILKILESRRKEST